MHRRNGKSPAIEIMAAEGLRVLEWPSRIFTVPDLPGEQHDFIFEFVGLVAC
jgi:hypothetical protein